MKSFIILSTLLTLTLSSAYATSSKPAKCPGISEIQSIGLEETATDRSAGFYVIYKFHNYGTPETWFFAIGVPLASAVSEEDALIKAREALPYLSGNPVPRRILFEDERWVCTYNDFPNGFKAHAITPSWG